MVGLMGICRWNEKDNVTLAKTKAIKVHCVSAQHFASFFLACWKQRTPLSAFIDSSVKFSKGYIGHKSKKINNTWVILDCTEDTMDEDTALSFSWEPPLKRREEKDREKEKEINCDNSGVYTIFMIFLKRSSWTGIKSSTRRRKESKNRNRRQRCDLKEQEYPSEADTTIQNMWLYNNANNCRLRINAKAQSEYFILSTLQSNTSLFIKVILKERKKNKASASIWLNTTGDMKLQSSLQWMAWGFFRLEPTFLKSQSRSFTQ